MDSRAGVKLRPTLEREKLRELVLSLRHDGLSYDAIIRKIEGERGIRLSKSHVSYWISGRHKPLGSVRPFNPVPSPELAYVIGVKLGDASMSVNKYHSYMIKLRVIDKEFAEEFSRCLGVILGRSPPRVKWHEKTQSWHTQVSSILLQNFLRRPISELARIVRHDKACTAAFLRGFFDSEGWVYKSRLGVANTNLRVLDFVSQLLESRFNIHVGSPSVTSRGGRVVMIKGKFYNANKDCYGVLVSRSSLVDYARYVGFTIIRKRERLALAINEFA